MVRSDLDPSRSLWVGNIGTDVNESMLLELFAPFGPLISIRILHPRYCAFINYHAVSSAIAARESLQDEMVGARRIVINFRPTDIGAPPEVLSQPSGGGPRDNGVVLHPESRSIWVGNVTDQMTQSDLLRVFGPFGPIESVRVLRAKTCAFVNFTRVDSAVKALNALQNVHLSGMRIRMNYAAPPSSVVPNADTLVLASPGQLSAASTPFVSPNHLSLPSNLDLSSSEELHVFHAVLESARAQFHSEMKDAIARFEQAVDRMHDNRRTTLERFGPALCNMMLADPVLAPRITERDSAILQTLVDARVSPGVGDIGTLTELKLTLYFRSPNPYLGTTFLETTFHLLPDLTQSRVISVNPCEMHFLAPEMDPTMEDGEVCPSFFTLFQDEDHRGAVADMVYKDQLEPAAPQAARLALLDSELLYVTMALRKLSHHLLA